MLENGCFKNIKIVEKQDKFLFHIGGGGGIGRKDAGGEKAAPVNKKFNKSNEKNHF